jgi:Domain of unknown function (DUF5916)/Carbohydrate family 9 binding domain-like
MKKTLPLIFTLLAFNAPAQKINESCQFHIKPTTSKIIIDGILNDESWKNTDVAKDFWLKFPTDTAHANNQTEVRLTYDDNFLYVSAICFKANDGSPSTVESLKRDYSIGLNESFQVVIEPFNDLTNGFIFGVNAAGAQLEGLISEGQVPNLNWDNKWASKTKYLADRWIVEMAIPFKTLRYRKDVSSWGLNFTRNYPNQKEVSIWARIPRQLSPYSLAYTGVLVWETLPVSPKANISIIPYALGGINKNFLNNTDATFRKDIGGDAKIALTSSLNLDLTLNPDFSQVDVDRQVTNLSRFELFFPERRQFFLENADLFNNFGLDNLRPFFSRRIGLGIPITYGARVSGKLNNNLRIGAMNIQTGSQDLTDSTRRPNQNFSALVLQQKVFKRSNIGLMFLNKESLNFSEKINYGFTDFNRNIGIEYNLASGNNEWTGKAVVMKSFSPKTSGSEVMQAYNLKYNPSHWLIDLQYENVGVNYNPEIGYVPRTGYYRLALNELSYLHFPKKANSKVFFQAPTTYADYYWNANGELTDAINLVGYISAFKTQSQIVMYFQSNYFKLQYDFDPTNGISNEALKAGSEHRYNSFHLTYSSSPRKKYTSNFSGSYGGYFGDGQLLNLSTTLGYRFQPYVNISANISYVDISDVKIPVTGQANKVVNSHFFLVSPKIDVTFSNTLFWTTFVQYNEQRQNTNINSRIQWRYKPASDIFLVYTDNYFPNSYEIKNRAVVLKMTYWLNL